MLVRPGTVRKVVPSVVIATSLIGALAGAASAGDGGSPHAQTATHALRAVASRVSERTVTRHGITHESITVAAVFRIPGERSRPATAVAADSSKNCAIDGSGSIKSCLTQNFEVCHVGGIEAVQLDSYVQRWINLDRGSALVQLATPTGIRAEVTGITVPRKCGGPSHTYPVTRQTRKIRDPGFRRYTFRPHWAGRRGGYVAVSGPGSQCGNSYTSIRRRREVWKLETPNVCQGTWYSFGP
jgi:hypothetical protein